MEIIFNKLQYTKLYKNNILLNMKVSKNILNFSYTRKKIIYVH